MNNSEFEAYTQRIERALDEVNTLADDRARGSATALIEALMDLHGAAMARIVELLSESRESLAKLADDPLICGMLVLYGVHPLSLEDRIERTVEKLRAKLQKQGTSLELVSTDNNVVRIKIQNSQPGAQANGAVQSAIEQAIREAAPEVVEIAIAGLQPSGFVPLNMIQPAMRCEGEAI
jgi:hypothetical protein